MTTILIISLIALYYINKRDNSFNDKNIERLEEQVKFLNEELGVK